MSKEQPLSILRPAEKPAPAMGPVFPGPRGRDPARGDGPPAESVEDGDGPPASHGPDVAREGLPAPRGGSRSDTSKSHMDEVNH